MLNWIISSSVLVAAVIVLRFALHKKLHPTLRYALWALVLLRLLVPFTVVHNPVSISSAVENTQISQKIERLEYVDAVEHAEDGSVVGVMHDFVYNTTVNDYVDSRTIVDRNVNEIEFTRWQRASDLKNLSKDILKPLWCAGMAVIAAWFIFTNLRFGALLRRSRQRLESDCPLPVYVSEVVETPCLYGLIAPAIYVTPAVAEDETALRHVLSHEVSHYHHGDHVWSIFRAAILTLHWYNPLVWWAAALSRRDAEMACDAAAIKALGEEQRTDYGHTLISLSCRRARANDLILTATTMTGGKRTLKERIAIIARHPQTRAAAAFVLAAAVIFLVALTFTGSAPSSSYIRPSSAEPMNSDFRLRYDNSINYVRVVCDLYQDGELLQVEDHIFPAIDVEHISVEPRLKGLDSRDYDIVVTVEGSGGAQEIVFDVTTGYSFEQYGWSTPTMPEPVGFSVGDSVMLMILRAGTNPLGFPAGEELKEHMIDFSPARSATIRLEFYGDKESADMQGSGLAYEQPLLMASDDARRFGERIYMNCENGWKTMDDNVSLYTRYRFGNLYESTLSVKYYQKGELMQESTLPYSLRLSRYACYLTPTENGWQAGADAYDYALGRATDSIGITVPVSGEPQMQLRSGEDLSIDPIYFPKVGQTYCLATAVWGDSVSRWGAEYEDDPQLIAEAEHLVLFEVTVEAHGGTRYAEYMSGARSLYIHLPPELTTWEVTAEDGNGIITGASVPVGGQGYKLTKDEYLSMMSGGDVETILFNRRYWAAEHADYVPEHISSGEYVKGTGELEGAIHEWTLHVAAPEDSTPESIVSTFSNEQIVCTSGALTLQNPNDFAVFGTVWIGDEDKPNYGKTAGGFALEPGGWMTIHDIDPDLIHSISFGAMVEENTPIKLTVLDHDACHDE